MTEKMMTQNAKTCESTANVCGDRGVFRTFPSAMAGVTDAGDSASAEVSILNALVVALMPIPVVNVAGKNLKTMTPDAIARRDVVQIIELGESVQVTAGGSPEEITDARGWGLAVKKPLGKCIVMRPPAGKGFDRGKDTLTAPNVRF